jgi:large subunit ribosomal protein L25
MQDLKLNAQKREVTGRKVKNLRKEGLIPSNVYGKKITSVSLSLKKDEFEKIFADAGETSVIKLVIDGEKEERPILIQNITRDPLTREPLHVDLRQIILTEKVRAMVPVEVVGEAPAVEQKLGILIQTVSELEVEALPMDLPEHFTVDVSKLNAEGDVVTIKELAYDKSKVEILTEDEELVLAKIDPLAEEEVAPAPTEGEEGVEAAAEGEAPAEGGEAPTEGGEEKKEEGQE